MIWAHHRRRQPSFARVACMTFRTTLMAAALTSGVGFIHQASAQANPEQLGTVHFETSCTPEAQ